MKKLLSLSLLSLLLVACQKTPDAASTDSGSSSSTAAPIMADNVLGDIQSATPDIMWSPVKVGTYGEIIYVDETNIIAANTVKGLFVNAPVQGLAEHRDSLTTDLVADGWEVHTGLDADGATGTQWGYKKTDGEGTRYLILSDISSDCESNSENEPISVCNTHESKVFLTEAVR